jgi:hypothetical protein
MATTGWPLERFVEPMDDFICPICREVCRNASTINCGHSFCESCILISNISDYGDRCSICRVKIIQQVPDFSKRMAINGKFITCINKEFGCKTSTSVLRIQEHEKTCDFRKVKCNSCSDMISLVEMEEHMKNQCLFRLVPCVQCKLLIQFSSIENHIENECPTQLVECNYCNWRGLRSELHTHESECQDIPVLCQYHMHGCDIIVPRRLKEEHEQTNHTALLSRALQELSEKLEFNMISYPPDGPYRILRHPHSMVLCSDLQNDSCDVCHKPIENKGSLWIGYRCIRGCNYTVCVRCFPSVRLYRSKRILTLERVISVFTE